MVELVEVKFPYTARDGSVTHFGATSEYLYNYWLMGSWILKPITHTVSCYVTHQTRNICVIDYISWTAAGWPSIRTGFYQNGVGWVKTCLGESQSRFYAHMRAQFGRGPTSVSKKVPFNFISRLQT